MEQSAQKIRLKLPEQDLHHLTIGSDQPKKLQAWVSELPLMNMGETSRQLYQYVQELNRFQVPTPQRFQLLEIVRPVVLHVCRALGKHYLNQSLVLPDKARRVASLAQALQTHLAAGYKLVAVRGLRRLNERDGKAMVAAAVHRAISAQTDNLVRSFQLYFPTPRHLWLELHQLFLLAEMNGVEGVEVADPDFSDIESSTVREAYARALLLSTARPNQLRQQEIAALYRATEQWSSLIDIKPAGEDADLFVFDLQADRPPTYRTHASVAAENSRYIESRELVDMLASVVAGNKPLDFQVPEGIPDNLLIHLQQSWGALAERSFRRVGQTGPIDICLGLSALHGHLSGGMDFDKMVRGSQLQVLAYGASENPFLAGRPKAASGTAAIDDDPWSRAHDGGGYRMAEDLSVDAIDISGITSQLRQQQEDSATKVQYESFTCQKINASPGGYCLEWVGASPAALRTGEMVGVRELGQNEWAIGVVRWVKQLAHQGAQFGVELLAPRATPAAARALRKTGDAGNFMRALLLPALHAIGQPATLLVPTVGFQAGGKVDMVANNESQRVTFHRKVNGTASFGQYEFRVVQTGAGPGPAESDDREGGEDFDSIWTSL
jgi:cyclic-di-GMP-binding protein